MLCSLTTGTTGLSLLACGGVELISMQMLPLASILSTCSRSMLAMASASSLAKIDSTAGSPRTPPLSAAAAAAASGGGECGGVGVDSSSGRWPGCCDGGGGGGGLWAGVTVGVADILLAALYECLKF